MENVDNSGRPLIWKENMNIRVLDVDSVTWHRDHMMKQVDSDVIDVATLSQKRHQIS